MKKINLRLLLIVSICLLLGCSSANNRDKIANNASSQQIAIKDTSQNDTTHHMTSDLCVTDSPNIAWVGGDVYSLTFQKHNLYYFYSLQCMYTYPTAYINGTIIMYWDYNEDCVYDRGLHKTYGVKSPEKGKPFASFYLINDTTLGVKYFYPEWVDCINKTVKVGQELFPNMFKLTPIH